MPARLIPRELNLLAPLVVSDLVRLGGEADGGYVVPRTVVAQCEVLVSFGIGIDWSFEEAFLKASPFAQVQAYDHTISEAYFRYAVQRCLRRILVGKSNLPQLRQSMRTLQAYRGFFQGQARHHPSRLFNRKDHPYDVTVSEVMERANSGKVFVKMDIEGSEYRVLPQLIEHSASILGLIVEFHDTEPLRMVFLQTLRGLLRAYEIVHLHGNNFVPCAHDGLPEVLEITFLRRDLCSGTDRRTAFPLAGLDRANDPTQPDHAFYFQLD